MADKDKRTYESSKEHGHDMSYENEVKRDLTNTANVLKKSITLLGTQTEMIAILTDKLAKVTNEYTKLELINRSHQELNGRLQVELSSLKLKGIKLSYDTNQPEKETTVFGTKI